MRRSVLNVERSRRSRLVVVANLESTSPQKSGGSKTKNITMRAPPATTGGAQWGCAALKSIMENCSASICSTRFSGGVNKRRPYNGTVPRRQDHSQSSPKPRWVHQATPCADPPLWVSPECYPCCSRWYRVHLPSRAKSQRLRRVLAVANGCRCGLVGDHGPHHHAQ